MHTFYPPRRAEIWPALDFVDSLGGQAKINAYCHELALAGGRRLAEVLGTRVMDETGELTLNMARPAPA